MHFAKVLFVYRYCGLGGVETSILTKLRALERIGVEGRALFSEYCGIGGGDIGALPGVSAGLNAAQIYALLRQDFDLITVVDYPEFLAAVERANIATPVLFETHASFPPLLERFYRAVDHPRIAAVVVPSRFNRNLVRQQSRTANEIVVIPNPVDLETFASRQERQEDPALGELSEGHLVLWIGRLEGAKNPAEFINIAKRLLADGLKAHFVIIGDVWNYDEYKNRLLSDVNSSERAFFTFLRSVKYDEMPAIYSLVAKSGGCLVSTSRHESQPMIFLEAMASNCPIVATDVGGVRELITDGATGRLYNVGDVSTAAQLVIDIVTEKCGTRRQLVANAMTYVSATHSLERIGGLYMELIEHSRRCRVSRHHSADQDMVPGLVSTIIPVYNRPALLAEAVESVLSQTYPSIEIIIVNDGSTDETGSVCDRLATRYEFIRVIHQSHTGLPGRAREAGRLLARGEFIQYLDSDDLLLPRKFAVMANALMEHPECNIAYCYTRRYVRGEPPRDVACERTGETFSGMLPEFLEQRFWHTCTPLYRRSLCDKAGPWSDLAVLEDMEYDMRIAKMNPRLFHCKEYLADFRDHSEPRLSTAGFLINPISLARLPRAYRLIYQHARSTGISYHQDPLRAFLAKVAWLLHRCAELGLKNEAEELAGIVRDAGGKEAARRLQGTPATLALSSLTQRTAEALFCIDSLNERIVAQQSHPVVVSFKQTHLLVTGWAVDPEAKDAAGGVYVTIDGAPHPAFYSSDRKDVADHFGVPQYRYSGFEALIPNVAEGRHALSLVILTKDGKGYYLPAQSVEFDLIRDDSSAGRITQ